MRLLADLGEDLGGDLAELFDGMEARRREAGRERDHAFLAAEPERVREYFLLVVGSRSGRT